MFTWSPSASSTTLQSIKSSSPSTTSFGRTLLENLTRSPLYHSLTSLDKTKLWSKFYVEDEENVQKVLDTVLLDQKVITNPRANRRRRTVVVTRTDDQPFGFTLQTYLLKRKGEEVPSKVTYVDYVQLDSPASDAGIRAGDVLISINGRVVTGMSHGALVELIGSCRQMRMVVIFENIRQRIELIARAIKLRKILNDKLYQLNLIDIEEQKILNNAYMRSMTSRKLKHSLVSSLSSAGTSTASSVSSAPSDGAGITSDAERSLVRIPTIITPTNKACAEINRHPFHPSTNLLERRAFSEVSCRRLTKPPLDFGRSKDVDTGLEPSSNQQNRCYGVDLEDFDRASIFSIDARRSLTAEHYISHDIIADDIDNGDVFASFGTTNTGHGSAVGNYLKINDVAKLTKNCTVAGAEAVFDSVALNHVIWLDDDVISSDGGDRINHSQRTNGQNLVSLGFPTWSTHCYCDAAPCPLLELLLSGFIFHISPGHIFYKICYLVQ